VPATSNDTLRVVVVDDSEVVRLKLRTLLEDHDIEVAAEASDGETGLREIESQRPDLVIMDLKMPGMSGIEATWKLGAIAPQTPVLVLTVSAEEEDVTDAIMAGAKGYVVKGGSDDEIVSTLRRLANGESVISSQIAGEIVDRAYGQREDGEGNGKSSSTATRVRPKKTEGNGARAMPIPVAPPGPAYEEGARPLGATAVAAVLATAVVVGLLLTLAIDGGNAAILFGGSLIAATLGLMAGRSL
jgi:DNA-binding NarL/FixJ family response regulator